MTNDKVKLNVQELQAVVECCKHYPPGWGNKFFHDSEEIRGYEYTTLVIKRNPEMIRFG